LPHFHKLIFHTYSTQFLFCSPISQVMQRAILDHHIDHFIIQV